VRIAAALLITLGAAFGIGTYLAIASDLNFTFGVPYLTALTFVLSALIVTVGSRARFLAAPVIALVSAALYGLWYLLAFAQTRTPREALADCSALGIDYPYHYERSYQPAGVLCVADDGSGSALASWPLSSQLLGALLLLIGVGAAASVALAWWAAISSRRSLLVPTGRSAG
jgi:hypothetical protein